MANEYDKYYALAKVLATEPRLIPAPNLYELNEQEIYAAQMDRLAQPLPNGEESPFSNRAPGSVQSIILSATTHELQVAGHELNLMPERELVQHFRILGVEFSAADYPVVRLRFFRSPDAIANRIPVEIPIATEVRSRLDGSLGAYTLYPETIDGDREFVDVPARLNQLGIIPQIRPGEFSEIYRSLPFIESVADVGTIYEGREQQTLSEAVLQAREGIRTGNLGRFFKNGVFDPKDPEFKGRCVVNDDYEFYTKALGATKVNVLSGVQIGASGTFHDLVTIAVYPTNLSFLLQDPLTALSMVGVRVSVVGADIIPVVGIVDLRVVPDLTNFQVRNLAAEAIASSINPPFGIWGDRAFESTLATALEQVRGIYAVPSMKLFHADTGEAIDYTTLKPWQLLEIQEGLTFNVTS